MTNDQTRMIATSIAMLSGAILCTTERIDINLGISILIIGAVLFVVEFFRLQKKN